MTTFTDPVAVLRAATPQATTAPTTRILDAAFTTGPMPLAHVHLLNTGPTDDVDRTDTIGIDIYATTPTGPHQDGATALAERLLSALGESPVVTSEGFVDSVEVTSCLGVRPYFEAVEVVSMVLSVTHRPLT